MQDDFKGKFVFKFVPGKGMIFIMKHVLSCEQFSREELDEIFNLTNEIKENPEKFSDKLNGKVVAVMFFEPSTRTRLSFESAVLRLGGKIIVTENAQSNSSAKKGETLEDTIRIISGYSDAIIMRHSDVNSSNDAAKVSGVPIINAGAGKGEHPTQSLLDLYTIKEHRGTLDGIKVAILGDLLYGRTIHSLIKVLSLYKDVEIYGLSKKEFALPQEYIDFLKEKGIEYKLCNSFDDIPKDVDVLYHTRIQSERFEGDFGKEEYIINKEVLDKFSSKTIVLHPLPRMNEISTDIDDDKRALYFKQAHNGMYVRMALLVKTINN